MEGVLPKILTLIKAKICDFPALFLTKAAKSPYPLGPFIWVHAYIAHIKEYTQAEHHSLKTRARVAERRLQFGYIQNAYVRDIWVIDQACGQDGWILAKFIFCVFMDRNGFQVHKRKKKNEANIQPS